MNYDFKFASGPDFLVASGLKQGAKLNGGTGLGHVLAEYFYSMLFFQMMLPGRTRLAILHQ
jgi:hypothetical protein